MERKRGINFHLTGKEECELGENLCKDIANLFDKYIKKQGDKYHLFHHAYDLIFLNSCLNTVISLMLTGLIAENLDEKDEVIEDIVKKELDVLIEFILKGKRKDNKEFRKIMKEDLDKK